MSSRLPATLAAVLAALLLSVLAGGCGGDDEPTTASGPGLPSQAELKAYFEAITSSDPDQIRTVASRVAAAGSLAQGYAAYDGEAAQAAAAGGQPIEAADVEEVDGGFKACAGPDQCVTWTHLEGKDGRLTDFAINDVELEDSLVDLTGQPPIVSAGLYRVQPEWAYRRPLSGSLNVVVTITASDVPLAPKPGTYIEEDQILKGVKVANPGSIEPGTSSPVVLTFPDAGDANLDGQVTFELGIGGQGNEPIGFGLADPVS